MPTKKQPKKPKKSAEPAGDKVLVRRVDAMMDTKSSPDTKKPADTKSTKDTTTAPALPPELLKDVGSDAVPEPESEPENPADPEPAAEPEAAPDQTAPADDPLEDSATDQAVDDIVAHEGDTVLAVNDALTARQQADAQPGQPSGPGRRHGWLWLILIVVVLGTAIDLFIFLSG